MWTAKQRIYRDLKDMMELKELARRLPKAELHLHIEGSLEPEMMFELAKRNAISLPYPDINALYKAYNFNNLQDFLDVYYQGMSVLQTEQDFFDLTWAYLQKCRQQNIVHCEIFFDPQGHTERGIGFETVINGITRALDKAETDMGISHRLIMCFLRHLDENSALQTLATAMPWLERIHGVGLDSSELGHPPRNFKNVFAKARNIGLKVVAHAGEEGPPAYVYEALDVLRVDRIDHGNRSLEDPELVRRLVDEQIPLTVCPLSNLRLAVVNDMAAHPIRKMLALGLRACVNSDDPSYFGGYMSENFDSLIDATGLEADEICQLVINGFESAFLPAEQKQAHLAQIESIRKSHQGNG
jgi:adenosine deaminase